MESKIIKAFFDGNLADADEVITTPKQKEYTDIDKLPTLLDCGAKSVIQYVIAKTGD